MKSPARLRSWFALLLVGAAARASGGVLDVADNGFTLRETVTASAPPDKAYAAMVDVAKWWSSDHTYSGNAANLSIDAKATGCFCEKLPNLGGVRHMTVVYVSPGKAIRFEGVSGLSSRWAFRAA